MGPFSRPDPFWQIRTESGIPCYHSITRNQIFEEAISIWGKPINIHNFNAIHLQNDVSIPFQNDLQNTCSEFKLFLQNINIQKKTWNECACRSILQNFLLYDSTLLNLGSAFYHYLSLGTCALVKQYAKHFHA